MDHRITPKNLVLSLLQVSDDKPVPIKALILCGELFGFSGNTIRVNVTRLIREKTVESDDRGSYRLSRTKNPVSRFINTWRLGESRRISWDGSWSCAAVPAKLDRAGQLKTSKALEILGFRHGLPGLWVRPANLAFNRDDIACILKSMGMHPQTELFTGRDFSHNLTGRWKNLLWDVDGLNRNHAAILGKLEESHERITRMPLENAMVESYIVGGEAIHALLTDPLLPDEIQQPVCREALTRSMTAYDGTGKDIWLKKIDGLNLDYTPSFRNALVQGK